MVLSMSLVALLQEKGSRLLRCTIWLVDYKNCKNLLMLSDIQQKELLLTKSLSQLLSEVQQNIVICLWQASHLFAELEG